MKDGLHAARLIAGRDMRAHGTLIVQLTPTLAM